MFTRIQLSLFLVLSSLLLAVSTGHAQDSNDTTDSSAQTKTVYGLHERVYVGDIGMALKAKLDTGAVTSSLSATNIKRFKRKGESWVRFKLAYKGAPDFMFELPLARTSRIKRRADDFDADEEKSYSSRPVIEMTVFLGEQQQEIEVNLTDRSTFKYPFLLGARAIRSFNGMVDPSVEYLVGKPTQP